MTLEPFKQSVKSTLTPGDSSLEHSIRGVCRAYRAEAKCPQRRPHARKVMKRRTRDRAQSCFNGHDARLQWQSQVWQRTLFPSLLAIGIAFHAMFDRANIGRLV
jgi:hypothetical protein